LVGLLNEKLLIISPPSSRSLVAGPTLSPVSKYVNSADTLDPTSEPLRYAETKISGVVAEKLS